MTQYVKLLSLMKLRLKFSDLIRPIGKREFTLYGKKGLIKGKAT
jgi:hypothetical protein